jgi:hypothetical protein
MSKDNITMSDKSTVLKAFNNQFFEFISDIQSIFPDSVEIKETKTALEFFRKANPTCIVKAWNFFVVGQYKEQIEKGDITFFFEKDYKSDLVYMANADEIMKSIDSIRGPVKNMNDANRETAMKYISNLSKLSGIYEVLSK